MFFFFKPSEFLILFAPEGLKLSFRIPNRRGHIFTLFTTCLVRLKSIFPPVDLFLEVPLCMLAFDFRLAFALFTGLLSERLDMVPGLHLCFLMKVISHRR